MNECTLLGLGAGVDSEGFLKGYDGDRGNEESVSEALRELPARRAGHVWRRVTTSLGFPVNWSLGAVAAIESDYATCYQERTCDERDKLLFAGESPRGGKWWSLAGGQCAGGGGDRKSLVEQGFGRVNASQTPLEE